MTSLTSISKNIKFLIMQIPIKTYVVIDEFQSKLKIRSTSGGSFVFGKFMQKK